VNQDEKICPRCAETIKRAAVVCRYCGHEFDEIPPAPPASPASAPAPGDVAAGKLPDGVLIGGGAVALILFIVLIAQCSTTPTNNAVMNADENLAALDVNATDLNSLDTNATAEVPTAPTGWAYDTSDDELRGEKIYRASMESSNSVSFDFPYNGGSTLRMTVRRHPEYGQDVIFVISKGQFTCGVDDCAGTINFGSGAESIALVEPSDNASDTLFAANADYVIGQLKKSKKVIVELPFYQEGNRQFTFDTPAKLKWPPNGAESKSSAAENLADD